MLTSSYKNFQGAFEWDKEAKVYSGQLLNIRGVATFEADTISTIETEFQATVDDWLEFNAEARDNRE